jgi:hypothetical protein
MMLAFSRDKPGEVSEVREVVLTAGSVLRLEDDVGNEGAEVGVTGSLSPTVDGSLDVHRAVVDGGHAVGDRNTPVVVKVAAQRREFVLGQRGHDRRHFLRHRSSVGVAEDETVRTGVGSRFEDLSRVCRIILIAVEKVLEIEEHFPPLRLQKVNRIENHVQVLFLRRLENLLNVGLPRLAHDDYRRRFSVQKRPDHRVPLGGASRLAG